MSRRAIVLVNSVSYGEASKSLPKRVVARIADDVAALLTGLEAEYRFRVTAIKDERRAKATDVIRRVLKAAGTDESLLLFYYFGHGLVTDDEDELYLYFKDSEAYDLPTMVKVSDIAEWMRQYGVPRVVVVMDCCHAGMIGGHSKLVSEYKGKYFLMASVTSNAKALVDYRGEQPVGLFTRFFLQGFGNPAARAHGRDVTFLSFFRYVDKRIRRDFKQQPYSVDNGLASELFFRQASQPVILPHLNRHAPKKSLYRKLFAIALMALRTGFRSAEALYEHFDRRRVPEFLQPTLLADGKHDYRCVRFSAFVDYIRLAREIGILEPEDPIALTALGKRMVRNDGAQYNVVLVELLQKVWATYGIKLEDLEDSIGQRLRGNAIPSADAIFADLILSKRFTLSKYRFKVFLDLTAYVGAVDVSADKAFFLASSKDED